MKNLRNLDEALELSLEEFRAEMQDNIDTFEGEYLTKDDMEKIARQTFYVFAIFRRNIVDYLMGIHNH